MRYRRPLWQICLISISLLNAALTGCMAGPDFHSPAAPNITRYTAAPMPAKTAGIKGAGRTDKAQHFVAGKDIPAEWWHVFHSPQMNHLILLGLANSPNLAAAKAALMQAQENFNAQVGATLLPAVGLNLSGERQRFSPSSFGITTQSSVFNLFDASVNVSYTLDLFGGLRRTIEASGAQVDFQQYELDAAYLTLTSNIVTTVITLASIQAQIKATESVVRSQEGTLAITERQFRLGGASRSDVLSQQAETAQTQAALPPLQQTLAQNRHALSVLVGREPSAIEFQPIDFKQLHLPRHVPVSLPSNLVRQRPDIQAAEALLHAASANIGVATANLYPQITLTGGRGWEGTVASHLFNPANIVWNMGAALAQPLFNGGALLAKKRAAVAAYQQAAAQYRQTVLQAFQQVADTLRALEHDAETLRAQKQAESAALNAFIITKKQYQLGGVSYLNLLIAERTYQQALIARIQAEAARYTDTAALFQALGGGWWNRPSLDCDGRLCRNLSQYEPRNFGKPHER